VFDEATSALDTDTEAAVMEAIEGLSRDLTLVMIAHRLSTISRCDRVIELEYGMVKRTVQPSALDHVTPA
jgi:ATP-binding cassette, subfamily B, bacterial PglK